MDIIKTVVIGGGAAGMVAAISARRKGASVLICEKMPRLGKKVLISGNGRCNLLNEELSESYYNSAAKGLVRSVFSKFGKTEIVKFFKDLGLKVYSKEGRVFPVTNQASSVLKVLEMELKRLSIPIELNFEVVNISISKTGFIIESKAGKRIEAHNVIIAGGGKTYPALGSDGSAHALAKRLGHSIIEPVPSAVPVVVKDRLCHFLQGQRISANVKSIIDGKIAAQADGELLFTKYGLSGTAILDISEEISIAVNRRKKKDVVVSVDMAPFMSRDALKDELTKRIEKGFLAEDLLAGILPNKFLPLTPPGCKLDDMVDCWKDKRFKVLGTRGWNEAEFTCGGVDVVEVNENTLESKFKKGLYLAGEVLDVNGKRGGYNLAWAWASGFVAGLGSS